MNMTRNVNRLRPCLSLLVVAVCAGAATTEALAQTTDGSRSRRQPPPFDAWDKNDDGFLTRGELPARFSKALFDRIDANKDGKLSRAEDDAYRKRNRTGRNRPQAGRGGNRRGAQLPKGTQVERDVVYETVGARKLPLDLYRPVSDKPTPLVIWIHGGGWRGGSKSGFGPAGGLLARGYAVASVEYRLSGEAIFPAAIADCKAAVSFLRLNAKRYNLDPDNFGVWGSSAGGHLVALLGTTNDVKDFDTHPVTKKASSAVQAVCDWFGPTDFLQMDAHAVPGSRHVHDRADSAESRFVGGPIQKEPFRSVVVRANPITYVSAGDPPILLVHGDNDVVVSHHQSELLHDALKKVKVNSTLRIVKRAGHGYRGGDLSDAELLEMAARFFDEHLRQEEGRGKSDSNGRPSKR